jgi:small subunit ribosomal protein S25e
MQDKKDTEDKEKEKKKKDKPTGQPKEKKPLSIMPPDAKNEKILGELKKMSVLTPYVVASRFGIRMSAAKVFLRQLEEGGKIQRVSGSHNIKIYKVD